MGGRGDVVGKGQAVDRVFKVHVQQALVGAVKGDAALRHGEQGVVVAHVGREDHDARVENVGPSNVRGRGKGVLERKELVGSAVGDDVGVNVHNLGELGLLPQIDLCKGRVEVGAVHQVEVGAVLVAQPGDGNDMVVDGPELGDGLGGDAVEGKEDGELSRGAGVSEGMGEDESAWTWVLAVWGGCVGWLRADDVWY